MLYEFGKDRGHVFCLECQSCKEQQQFMSTHGRDVITISQ